MRAASARTARTAANDRRRLRRTSWFIRRPSIESLVEAAREMARGCPLAEMACRVLPYSPAANVTDSNLPLWRLYWVGLEAVRSSRDPIFYHAQLVPFYDGTDLPVCPASSRARLAIAALHLAYGRHYWLGLEGLCASQLLRALRRWALRGIIDWPQVGNCYLCAPARLRPALINWGRARFPPQTQQLLRRERAQRLKCVSSSLADWVLVRAIGGLAGWAVNNHPLACMAVSVSALVLASDPATERVAILVCVCTLCYLGARLAF